MLLISLIKSARCFLLAQLHLLPIAVDQKKSLVLKGVGLASLVELGEKRIVFHPFKHGAGLELVGQDLRQAGFAHADGPFDDNVFDLSHLARRIYTNDPKLSSYVIVIRDGDTEGQNRPDVHDRSSRRIAHPRRTIGYRRMRLWGFHSFQSQLLRPGADAIALSLALGKQPKDAATDRHRLRGW